MIRRRIVLSAGARADLRALRKWIRSSGAPLNADAYVGRIKTHLAAYDFASERGTKRDDVLQGLRVVGFERRMNIALKIEGNSVLILRIFYGGQDWERHFRNGVTETGEAED